MARTPTQDLQFDSEGNLKHLISLDSLSPPALIKILETADTFFQPNTQLLGQFDDLKNKTLVNLFFEPSTRTRSTFELAAKRLSAGVLNFNVATSATTKGESLLDTVKNLVAMQCDFFVIRHGACGAAQFVAQNLDGPNVINAGDGTHAHPTQALLDVYTIRKHRGDLSQLNVAIIGDILHSRVARSQIQALRLLKAADVRVIAPKTLLPHDVESLGVRVFHDLKLGLESVDIIIMLRLQLERMQQGLIPMSHAYYREFGLTQDALSYANPNALIIHPGPINRGVEIQSEIADSPNAVILDQVTNGIAVRMAIMSLLANQQNGLGHL